MTERRIPRLTIAAHALTLLGAILAAFYWWQLTSLGSYAWDAGIYYRINLDDLYAGWVVGGPDAFQYSPAFAQVIGVLRGIFSFEVFVAIWRAAELAIVVYLAGPLTIPVLLWGPVASEVNAGNVNLFLALAVALGFRTPGSWAFVLLTKVTPAVGLLWFPVRREWRKLAVAVSVTALVSAVSFAVSPGQWIAWVSLILGHSSDNVVTFPYFVPLLVRLPVAALVVVVAARLGWRWIVPVAAMLAAPVLYFPTQSIAIGALPFVRHSLGRRLRELLQRSRPARTIAEPIEQSAPVIR
ncbi:MAG TPA: glycosyltransferase family 87 protein [Candidatus Limnocylindrales bacterium]|nr:glycosyltransferase family 87 protein [Candidatus Limnocylindrales bacterium]